MICVKRSFSVQNASGLYLAIAALLVVLDQLGAGARLGLLAADAGDPALGALRARARAPATLAGPQQCSGPLHGLPGFAASTTSMCDAEAILEAPSRSASVSGNRTPVSIVTIRVCGAKRVHGVDEHRLLLLEGAQQHQAVAVTGARLAQRGLELL